MYHLDNTSGVPEMPEPKDTQTISTRWFGESQEQGGISWPGADWFNIIQAELLAILELADESPDKAKFNQIATAINKISNEFSLRMSESTGPTLVGYGDNETLKINLFKRLRQIRIIEEFGATGDGITDDSDAFERAAEWLAGGDYRALHTSSDARYRITRNIVFNFNRGAGAALFMKSPITPTGFSGEVMSFINGRDVDLILYVDGGGRLADYSQESPEGYQNVFHIRGIRNGSFSVRGRGCKSRILKIDNELPGEIKTSLNVIRYILTGDLVTGGSPDGQCGQSLWANGTSAFGTIMLAHTNWDLYGPVFNKVVDLTITKWEGGWNSNHGAVFQGCGSMCIKNFSVGDETNSVDLLTIKPASDGTPSFGIDILSGMSIGGKRGLVIESNNSNTAGINVHSFKTLKNSEVGVYLYNVHNSNINLHCAGDTVGLIVAGASHSLTGRVDIRGCAAQGLIIKPGLSNVVFSGVIERNAVKQAAPEVEVETEGYIDGSGYSNSDVRFGMLDVRSTTALSSGCYKLPTNNAIGIYQGFVSSINGLLMIAGTPNVARDIKGYATERSGHTDIAKDTVEIQVPHLLGAAPRTVQVTPTSSGWPAEWYVPHDKKTATSFTIRIPSGAPVQLSCDWRVSATAR